MAKIAKKLSKYDAKSKKVIVNNRKAWHDYRIEDVVETGLVLIGTEVKSLRMGRASLVDGFASDRDGELWLENVHIPEYSHGAWTNHTVRRRRKLLMHRHEIDKLLIKTREAGYTLVPLSMYFIEGRVKVDIALAKGKKQYDKRQTLRERQDQREAERVMSLRRQRCQRVR